MSPVCYHLYKSCGCRPPPFFRYSKTIILARKSLRCWFKSFSKVVNKHLCMSYARDVSSVPVVRFTCFGVSLSSVRRATRSGSKIPIYDSNMRFFVRLRLCMLFLHPSRRVWHPAMRLRHSFRLFSPRFLGILSILSTDLPSGIHPSSVPLLSEAHLLAAGCPKLSQGMRAGGVSACAFNLHTCKWVEAFSGSIVAPT